MATAIRGGTGAAITFGLVTVPVRSHGAVRSHAVTFSGVHASCNTKLKQGGQVCPYCTRAVEPEEVARAVLVAKDTYVQVTDDEIESLPLRTTRAIEVVAFVDAGVIDPVLFERIDWLGPDDRAKVGQKGFVLFRDALVRSGKVAIAKTTKSGKETLCIIRPRGKALEMARLHWRDEIVDVAGVEAGIEELELSEQEVTLADQLVAAMAGDADQVFADQADGFKAALDQLLEAKMTGSELPQVAVAAPAESDDLMAALKASLGVAA